MFDSTDPEANKMVREAERRDVIAYCTMLARHSPFAYATHSGVMDDIVVVDLGRPNDHTVHHHDPVACDTHSEVMVEVMDDSMVQL